MKKIFFVILFVVGLIFGVACSRDNEEQISDLRDESEYVAAQTQEEKEPIEEAEEEHPLVGRWAYSGWYAFLYIFSSDGTGSRGVFTRGHGFTVPIENFTWRTEGSNLVILQEGQQREERWRYTIDGELFSIVRANLIGRFSYIRIVDGIPGSPIPAPPEHPLIGMWVNEENLTNQLIFRADGTGVMQNNRRFNWYTEDEDHLLVRTTYVEESWTFAVNYDAMTLTSRQHRGLEFNFKAIDEAEANLLAETAGMPPAPDEIPDYITIRGEQYSTSSAELSLKELDLRNEEIRPLRFMVNLISLDLSGNLIYDLMPLAHLTSLEILDLSDNEVRNTAPLGSLTNLRILDISNNGIRNLAPLAELTNIERLSLSGNFIGGVMPLENFTNLTVLRLDYNEVLDLSPLINLTSLEILDLSSNRIDDLTALANLTNLTELLLYGNQIIDWSPVSHVQNVVGRP